MHAPVINKLRTQLLRHRLHTAYFSTQGRYCHLAQIVRCPAICDQEVLAAKHYVRHIEFTIIFSAERTITEPQENSQGTIREAMKLAGFRLAGQPAGCYKKGLQRGILQIA